MSNFAMGTILGKGFAKAQVHTNHSMSAEGLVDEMIDPATQRIILKIVGFLLSESYKDHRKNNLAMSSIKSMPLPIQE